MITDFTKCSIEERFSLDELETMYPDQLGDLLISEMLKRLPNLEYIRDMLDVGCSIEYKDRAGLTPLAQAARDNKGEIIEFLISGGADVNSRDNLGRTALHTASHLGKFRSIIVLLSNGARVDVKDDRGKTAWNYAASKTRELFPVLNPNK